MASTEVFLKKSIELNNEFIDIEKAKEELKQNKLSNLQKISGQLNSEKIVINNKYDSTRASLEQYWNNAKAAVETIKTYLSSMQMAVGKRVESEEVLVTPNYYEINDLITQANMILEKSFASFVKRLFSKNELLSLKKRGAEFYNQSYSYLEYLNHVLSQIAEESNIAFLQVKEQESKELASSEQKNRSDIKQLEEEFTSNNEALTQKEKELLTGEKLNLFAKELLDILRNLNAFSKEWDEFVSPNAMPDELLIGRIAYDFTCTEKDEIKKHIPDNYIENEFILPFTISSESPALFVIRCDKASRTQAVEGVQSVIYRLIQSTPPNSINLTFIDPIDRGSNLGSLLKLLEIPGSEVCPKVFTSRDDIRKQLYVLEQFVDSTSTMLQGKGTLFTYNHDHNPVPYNWVVINDFPEGFETSSLDALKVLLNNAEKCGISIVFISNESQIEKVNDFINTTQNKDFKYITWNNGRYNVFVEDAAFKFDFYAPTDNDERFLDLYADASRHSLFIDNSFKTLAPVFEFKTANASDGLLIPFAVDKNNQPYSFELGTTTTTNAFISGEIGSGKSTLLHSIISGITMNYSPDEVELWLVDYKKAEFAEYIKNPIPHVSLIGLERTKEFTYNLLDRLYDEFTSRMKLFADNKVQDLKGYYELRKNAPDKYKNLPRIVLMVDEFHVLCQNINDEQEYKIKLENALSEYRALGLSCILCDQSVTDGLKGLTSKGLKQILVRMAMRNSLDEINDTLVIEPSLKDDQYLRTARTLNTGDVMLKRTATNHQGARVSQIEKVRVVNVSGKERDSYIPELRKHWKGNYQEKELIVVDANSRKERLKEDKKKYNQKHKINDDILRLYLGKPASFESSFVIDLERKAEDNIVISGGSSELRFSVLLHSVISAIEENAKVYFFTNRKAETVRNYFDVIEQLQETEKDRFVLASNAKEVSQLAYQLLEEVRNGEHEKAVAVFSGLEEMIDDFDEMPQAPLGNTNYRSSDSNILLEDIRQEIQNKKVEMGIKKSAENGSSIYNAKPIIAELITRGSRSGLHCIIDLPTIRDLEKIREIKLEKIRHKIAFIMNEDDCRSYLGKASYITSIDAKEIDISGVYFDGKKLDIIRPYVIPTKENLFK